MNRIVCSVPLSAGVALALPATAAESLATTLTFDDFAATTVGQHLPGLGLVGMVAGRHLRSQV